MNKIANHYTILFKMLPLFILTVFAAVASIPRIQALAYRGIQSNAEQPSPKHLAHTGVPSDNGSIKIQRREPYSLPVDVYLVCGPHQQNYGYMMIGKEPKFWQFTQPQQFKMMFDTGSIPTWVPGKRGMFEYDDYKIYKPKKTIRKVDLLDFEVNYEDGNYARGRYYRDKICMNTTKFGQVCASKQYLGVATQASRSAHVNYDGVLGLGNYADPALQKEIQYKLEFGHYSVLENILKQNNLAEKFSLRLQPDGSILTLGGVRDCFYKNDIVMFNVISNEYGLWTIECQAVSAGGRQFKITKTILDTGSELMLAPAEAAEYLYNQVEANAQGQFPCHRMSKLPELIFRFEGFSVAMKPVDYVIRELYQRCTIAVKAWNRGEGTWLLGELFLHKVFTVFDIENQMVGFASPTGSDVYLTYKYCVL